MYDVARNTRRSVRIDALLVIDDEILYGQHDVLLSGDFSWSQYFKKEERELLCATGGHICQGNAPKPPI